MLTSATTECRPDRAVAVGARHWLRAARRADRGRGGVLLVESAARADARWCRVDHDVVALMRAATRLLSCDPTAARAFVAHASELAEIERRDANPVTGLVRSTYPLLASVPPWPLAAVPDTIPPDLHVVFRQRSLRSAAEILFPGRATRPVVKRLGMVLTGSRTCDMFKISVAMAAGPLLEPDRLVRVLDVGEGGEGRPLDADARRRLAALLEPISQARRERVVCEGLRDQAQRDRMRFVLGQAASSPPATGDGNWERLAVTVALNSPAPA